MTGLTASPSWKVEIVVPAAVGETFVEALEEHTGAVAMFAAPEGGAVRISGYAASEPDEPKLQDDLAAASRAAGIAAPHVHVVWLPATDWAAVNRESFEPLRVGGVWIRDSYHSEPAPVGAVTLVVDAATAFGTGHHGTTQGCLMALENFARKPRRLPPGPVLDVGCGTGILAMAAAKRLRRPVVASDIDPVAVSMAAYNVRRNRLGSLVRLGRSTGYAALPIRRARPYALIFANILARPLMGMAPDCARHLKRGGFAILSGLLTEQERPVIAAHRQQGLILTARYRLDGWSTLVVRRPM